MFSTVSTFLLNKVYMEKLDLDITQGTTKQEGLFVVVNSPSGR